MDFSTSALPNSLQECKKFHRPPSYKFPASAPGGDHNKKEKMAYLFQQLFMFNVHP
jgi:hypothetical protein